MAIKVKPVAANAQPKEIEVPAVNDVIARVGASLGTTLPASLVTLVARYAMERFEDQIFGCKQWESVYGVIPVSLQPIESLRDRANQLVNGGAKKLQKSIEGMSPEECSNFVEDSGDEETPQLPEELYVCLNTPVRPGEKVAGLTCAVTYIPQYVRRDNKVMAVTTKTFSSELGPHTKTGAGAKLNNPEFIFDRLLKRRDADSTEPSHYFVMERGTHPQTMGTKPSELIARMAQQKDSWKLPEPRNFIATVFSRCSWQGQFLFGRKPVMHTYCLGTSQEGNYLAFGDFEKSGLCGYGIQLDVGPRDTGVALARKFLPLRGPIVK